MKKFILGVLCGVLFVPVYAAATAPQTEIVTDQESGVIRFVVNGEEVAKITSQGISVKQDVEFGGTIIDIGGSYE